VVPFAGHVDSIIPVIVNLIGMVLNMGLDTSHDCWHGPYSSFGKWREAVARAANIPLGLMQGFYPYSNSVLMTDNIQSWLPIKWAALRPDILHILLYHSDCEGTIPVQYCDDLADRLEETLPFISHEERPMDADYWRDKTRQFIQGLRLAASRGEDVEFH